MMSLIVNRLSGFATKILLSKSCSKHKMCMVQVDGQQTDVHQVKVDETASVGPTACRYASTKHSRHSGPGSWKPLAVSGIDRGHQTLKLTLQSSDTSTREGSL